MGCQESGGQQAKAWGQCYLRNESPADEDRLILIALSSKPRLLFVVHAEVGRDAIRIVSARRASPAQRKIYNALD